MASAHCVESAARLDSEKSASCRIYSVFLKSLSKHFKMPFWISLWQRPGASDEMRLPRMTSTWLWTSISGLLWSTRSLSSKFSFAFPFAHEPLLIYLNAEMNSGEYAGCSSLVEMKHSRIVVTASKSDSLMQSYLAKLHKIHPKWPATSVGKVSCLLMVTMLWQRFRESTNPRAQLTSAVRLPISQSTYY
jgi:hypothetical protein